MVSVRRWWTETCRFCRVIDRALTVLAKVLFIVCAAIGSYVVIDWFNDTHEVVRFEIGDVSPSTGRPGDVLIFYQPIRKERNCWGAVRRVLVGDCGLFIVSESPAWISAPWYGRLTYAVQIPYEAIPGKCGFQVVGRFVCNPLDLMAKPRLVASTPIPFQVLRYDQ